MTEHVSNPDELTAQAGSDSNEGLGDWMEYPGVPPDDGTYLARMDEDDDESEYEVRIVKSGSVFDVTGRKKIVWNLQWKRIA